jgi:hypothetical protein
MIEVLRCCAVDINLPRLDLGCAPMFKSCFYRISQPLAVSASIADLEGERLPCFRFDVCS